MAFIKDGKVIRRCIKCSITSDIIDFKKIKDSDSGKTYTQNICIPCFTERQARLDRAKYLRNRMEIITRSNKWNIDNKDRYNKRRRINNKFFNKCLYAV